jgi:spermidine synthase
MARFVLIPLLSLCVFTRVSADDFVKEFESLYGHIIIQQRGMVVEMFATHKGWMARESGIDLADPSRIIVPYVRGLFAGSLARPSPQKVLVIGLGGGGFNRLFNEVYHNASLTTVEIDQKVLDLAKEFMGFQEHDRNRVVIRDGRSFIRRSTEMYDWIILDAFHGSVVPPHLKTVEFYKEIAAHLAPDGTLISNLHDGSELLYYDIATLRAAFKDVVLLRVPGTGNIIALAANSEAGSIESALHSFDPATIANPTWHREIDPKALAAAIIPLTEADLTRGRVMTDDFAPADYYKIVPAPTIGR